jgi:hypothetical protein
LSALPNRYPLDQSPFYMMKGKGQFEAVVGVDWDAVPRLVDLGNYRVWHNEKRREIQQPLKWLLAVHGRIAGLLQRIDIPDYVYSQKGRSYAANAKQHLGHHPVVKTDISSFYPSVTHASVRRMFREQFQCAADVATRLADICCYDGKHLPTGSPLSGIVAFFAAKPMFGEIAAIAHGAGCTMTVYVDDITLSGIHATRTLLQEVRDVVHRYGLRTKATKSKSFAADKPKTITGVIVTSTDLRLPNSRHKLIDETRKALAQTSDRTERLRLQRQLQGREQEARQVEKLNMPTNDASENRPA